MWDLKFILFTKIDNTLFKHPKDKEKYIQSCDEKKKIHFKDVWIL